MKTNEAIDEKINLLLNLKALYKHSDKPNYARTMNDCIKAIERGEKFKAMWGNFKKEWKGYNLFKRMGRGRNVGYDVQKYFPKPKKVIK